VSFSRRKVLGGLLSAAVPGTAVGQALRKPKPNQLYAQSAMLVDAYTGEVLFEKNADARRPVASTQKLLTAILAVESGRFREIVGVKQYDANAEPTRVGIKAGDTYPLEQLVKALLVKSGNDLARCIGRNLSGSEEEFAKLMTLRGRHLGMNDSLFKTASGLPAPDQYSTARDMAKAARAAYALPEIRGMITTRQFTFTFSDGTTKNFYNTNRLLGRLPGCDGMKTGYTHKAGRCLIASANRGARAVISVALKSTSAKVWGDSRTLLEWGLSLPPYAGV
jgi:D-alanyl-D-alanine carboxypeptidase (penicillin-binding protein 5/6)